VTYSSTTNAPLERAKNAIDIIRVLDGKVGKDWIYTLDKYGNNDMNASKWDKQNQWGSKQ
jgi:hypothetical protein